MTSGTVTQLRRLGEHRLGAIAELAKPVTTPLVDECSLVVQTGNSMNTRCGRRSVPDTATLNYEALPFETHGSHVGHVFGANTIEVVYYCAGKSENRSRLLPLSA